MFCHLTLQGKPAPKREPEVSLTSFTVSSLVVFTAREKGGKQYRFKITNLGEAHSTVAAFICLCWRIFFQNLVRGMNGGSGALRPEKQRSGIGWGRLMPLVKWCWHAEGLLWEVVIHHDFRMTQSSTRLLGLWSGIHDGCEVEVCVGGRSEKETVCFSVLNIRKDRPAVELFLWRSLFNFPIHLVKEVNWGSTD